MDIDDKMNTSTTDFGFEKVAPAEKAQRVGAVFDRVAKRYDLMNDVMSMGLHRLWKSFAISQSGVRAGSKVLDVAGGTGDLTEAFLKKVGPRGEVWLTDINFSMLQEGRDRLLDKGLTPPTALCDAEHLPFADFTFDCVSVAFGLRNMTDKLAALREMTRVLKPGGRLLVLEFSKVWQPLSSAYDFYSFRIIPRLGQMISGDADSYRYLAESIRMHPDQQTLAEMMESAGLQQVDYFNLSAGIVALHRGYKI